MLSTILAIAGALTAPDPEPDYEVRWDAPPECGTADDVRAEVSRLGIAAGPSDQASIAVSGTVARNDDGTWRLTLVVDRGGRPRARALEATSCRALVDSAAFIVAIALDPSIGGEDPQPEAPEPAPREPAALEPEPEDPKPVPQRALWFAVQGSGGVRVGAWPVGGVVELSLALQGPRWRAELGGAYDTARTFDGLDPSVAMRMQAGRAALRGCYAATVGRVAFPTCGVAEVGGLDANGRRLEANLRRRRLWLAFGLRGGVEVHVVGPLSLALTGEALIPVIQHEFVAGPEPVATIHRLGSADARVAGHVRLRFP